MRSDDGDPKARGSSSDRREGSAWAAGWDDDQLERAYSVAWIVAGGLAETEADAADLVQECVIKVVDQASRCAEWPLSRVWMARVARNCCIDRLRSDRARRRRERSVADSDLERAPDGEPLPDRACEASRRRDAVRAALADLPPVQREALRAVFLEGRSCREAAASLGLSKSTVHRAVREGVARLKASGKLAAWVNEASAPRKEARAAKRTPETPPNPGARMDAVRRRSDADEDAEG